MTWGSLFSTRIPCWVSAPISPYDDRYYRTWAHELPPLRHRERGVELDLHHNLLMATARSRPSAELLLADAVPVPGSRFHVLAPVHDLGGRQSQAFLIDIGGIGRKRPRRLAADLGHVPDIAGGSAMRITAPGNVERIVATWYRVGNVLTANPSVVKLETLKAKLLGGPQRAVAVHVSAEILPGHDPRVTMQRFLSALGPIDVLADGAAGIEDKAPRAAIPARGGAMQPVGS